MPFMDLYTRRGQWFVVETTDGSTTVAASDLALDSYERVYSEKLPRERALKLLRDHVDGEIVDYKVKIGWCARYSANGYLDHTHWCGPFETREEAERECKELYGPDMEEVIDDEVDQ